MYHHIYIGIYPFMTHTPPLTALIDRFMIELNNQSLSAHTLAAYQRDLERLARWLEASSLWWDITAAQLEGWLSDKTINTSSSTVNRRIATLRKFYQWAVDQQYLTHNPASGLRTVKNSSAKLMPYWLHPIQRIHWACGIEPCWNCSMPLAYASAN